MCSYKHSVDYTINTTHISIAGLNDYTVTSFISVHTDIIQIKNSNTNLEPIGHCQGEWLIIRSHSACHVILNDN